MSELQKAIELAMQKWVEENGVMEDGDEFITVFDNFCLHISFENGNLNTSFVGGKPYVIDGFSLKIYEN